MQQSQQMSSENPMQQFMQMAGTTGIGKAATSKAIDSNRLLSLLNLANKEFTRQQLTPIQLVEYLNDNNATPEDIWGLFRYYGMDNPMVPGMINSTLGVQPKTYTNFDVIKQRADGGVIDNPGFNALPEYVQEKILDNMKSGGEMIKRADGSYSQRGFWDNIRAAAERNKAAGRSGKEPTEEMRDMEKKLSKKALGGTSDGCPEGFYYDANTGDCLPIPEEVGGRPASAYSPSSLQGFLERGSAREKTLSDLTGNLNLSQEELAQLELDLKNEYADVERKRKNILVQAERQSALTKNVRDKLNNNDPAYVKPFSKYMDAETPAQARAAISSMPVDMRDAIVRNGDIGIATQPSARGIMCASGVCDVALNAGYNIPFMPGNVTFINYAKNNPKWEIVDQNNAQPGDIYSATGWAPANYRDEHSPEVLRGHDLSIVADQSSNKALVEKWRNDAIKYDYEDQIRGAKPIVLYGNQGADFGFKPFVREMYPKSQVLALQGEDRGTKDYGTVMRYIGDTGILKDQIANQNTLINTLQSNLEDADLNMIAGLPTLRAQPIEIDLPEREIMAMQQLPEEEKRRRLLGMNRFGMNRYRLRRPVKFT